MLIKTLQDLLRSTYKIPGVLWEIGTSSVCNCQCAEDAIFTNGKTGWFYREVHILNIGFRGETHTKSLHAEFDTGFCVAALNWHIRLDMGSFQCFQRKLSGSLFWKMQDKRLFCQK